MKKKCKICNKNKPLLEFELHKRTPDSEPKPLARCKECVKKIRKEYEQNNKEWVYIRRKKWRELQGDILKQRTREANWRLKLDVLKEYGGKCRCCGEDKPEFLAIDHINNDGGVHRKELKTHGGTSVNYWLKKNNYPKDRFQILCHNCNMAKQYWKVCPHQRTK